MKKAMACIACLLLVLLAVCACGRTKEEEMSDIGDNYCVPKPTGESHAEIISEAARIADGKTLSFPDGEYVIDKELIINCDVSLSGHTMFRVVEGGALTINGEINAGKRRIFLGDGNIRLNLTSGYGYIEWFEDEDDGDTVKLQKAFDGLNRIILTDVYTVSGIEISYPVTVVGKGSHRIGLKATAKCTRLFTIRSGGVSFENFCFDMSATSEEAVCFYADTEYGDISGLHLKDCYIDAAFVGVTDADGAYSVTDALLSGVSFRNARGTQLILRDFEKDLTLIEVAVLRRHSDTVSCRMAGAIIENAEDVLIEHFDVNGDFTDEGTEGHGVIFRNCKKVKMSRALMEYLSGSGFIIENCSEFEFENVQTYTYTGYGFYIDGLADSVFNVVKVTYNQGDGRNDPELENYRINNCRNVTLNSVISNGSRGAGLSLSGNTDVRINGYLYCDRLPGGNGVALLDGGGNNSVTINGFIDGSSFSGNSLILTGSGITVNAAVTASGRFEAELTDGAL